MEGLWNPVTSLMESSNQFNESFRQGLLPGYVFAATFSIVFCMAYYVPTQLMKKRKNKKYTHKEARQMRKLSHQELKQKCIKEVVCPFCISLSAHSDSIGSYTVYRLIHLVLPLFRIHNFQRESVWGQYVHLFFKESPNIA